MILHEALRRTTARSFAFLLLGNAALLILGWAWLYIPDSHAWQFLFSMLFAAVIFSGFFALHATVIRRLHPPALRTLWRSAFILAAWLLLARVFQHFTGLISVNIESRAGYWNSLLSAHNRAFFIYERLIDWQNLFIQATMWIVIPALLLPFTVETVAHAVLRSSAPWRTAAAVLRRPELWITVVVTYIAGSWLSGRLLAWHPGHSSAAELVSLFLRAALVYSFAVALLLLTLTMVAELLSREHTRRNSAF